MTHTSTGEMAVSPVSLHMFPSTETKNHMISLPERGTVPCLAGVLKTSDLSHMVELEHNAS